MLNKFLLIVTFLIPMSLHCSWLSNIDDPLVGYCWMSSDNFITFDKDGMYGHEFMKKDNSFKSLEFGKWNYGDGRYENKSRGVIPGIIEVSRVHISYSSTFHPSKMKSPNKETF